jgi:HK97 family phage prohead protease
MDTYVREIGFAIRSYDMETRSSSNGRILEGYVAVFNTRTKIPDRNGDFEEEILPGFAERSLRDNGKPVLQFDHGKDVRVGSVPIGVYTSFEQDRKGYHVRGELFDNPVVEPVRQAIAGGAIKGMSFRFKATKDRWERRGQNRGMDLRQVIDADVPEAGPVVFPAYAATSVSVRDVLAGMSEETRDAYIRELLEAAGLATDLTGAPTTWRGGRGEPDAQPGQGEASTPAQRARAAAMRTLRNPIILP